MKRQGIAVHPEGTMNVCNKFHSNPSSSCYSIIVEDRLTDLAAARLKIRTRRVNSPIYHYFCVSCDQVAEMVKQKVQGGKGGNTSKPVKQKRKCALS